jgi:very-short-patch-repair endonuclease
MVQPGTEEKRGTLARNRSRAKTMRHEPVIMEKLFWSIARNRQIGGFKFKRQVPIGPYIADFVCFERKIIIELDGPLHNATRDAKRDDYLEREGYQVHQFSNSETADDLPMIRATILNILQATAPPHPHPHPNPLPRRGRGNERVE